jgi:hypothetical protein
LETVPGKSAAPTFSPAGLAEVADVVAEVISDVAAALVDEGAGCVCVSREPQPDSARTARKMAGTTDVLRPVMIMRRK